MNSKYVLLSHIVFMLFSATLHAQNVGIGTATPLEKLHVAGNLRVNGLAGVGTRMVVSNPNGTLVNIASGANGQVLTQTGGGPAWQASNAWKTTGNAGTNSTTDFAGTVDLVDYVIRTNSNEVVRLTTIGLVGIGTGSPMDRLHVAGDIRVGIVSPVNTGLFPSYGNRITFSGGNAGPTWDSDNRDPIYLARYNVADDASELRLQLGDNCSTVDAFVINAGVGCGVNPNSTIFRFESDGAARKMGGGTWSVLSDQRLKRNIYDFTDGLKIIQSVRPVTFEYNGLGQTLDNGKSYVGVLAQELQRIAPSMVDSTGEFLVVDPSAFTYILMNAVKEQQKQIAQLQEDLKNTQSEFRRHFSESNSGLTKIGSGN